MSMLVLWFLFTHPNCKIPCTAPTQAQMYDVLWSEISKWIEQMPEGVKEQFEHTSDHVTMKESPKTWFARAKTGKKENPEALA